MKHDQVLRAPGYTLVGSPPPRLKYAATMARWSSWDTVGLCRDTSPGKHTVNDMERTASQDDVILPQKSLTISTSSLCKVRHSASTPNGLSGISHQAFPPLSPNLLKTSVRLTPVYEFRRAKCTLVFLHDLTPLTSKPLATISYGMCIYCV